jgi:hypothetical protein
LFSGGFFTLDTTTTPLTIVLTAGTDQVTQANYIYIPKSTKVLTVSTVGFPADEHCKIAEVDCQSASDIEAKGGARGNQNFNDHIKKEDDNGHILHLADWIRRQYATIDPRDGCEVTLDDTAGNGYLTMTSGKVSQLHLQTVNSLVMPTAPIMIANDFTTPFVETSNLNTINAFSDGSSWNNKWGKIVVWIIANKTGEPDFLLVNTPRSGYTSSADALLDESQTADYSIPIQYKSKAVLLGAFAINLSAGTLNYSGGYQDLRGTIPSNIAGGGGGGGGGVTSYLALSDTPSSFIGQAGKQPVVNSGETALEFVDILNNGVSTGLTTSDTAEENYALGAQGLVSGGRLTVSEVEDVIPSFSGWTNNVGNELRATKKAGICYLNGIVSGPSMTLSAGVGGEIAVLGATITGLRFSQISASAFNGTAYIAGTAQVGATGTINWGGVDVTNCTTIRINGILDVEEIVV